MSEGFYGSSANTPIVGLGTPYASSSRGSGGGSFFGSGGWSNRTDAQKARIGGAATAAASVAAGAAAVTGSIMGGFYANKVAKENARLIRSMGTRKERTTRKAGIALLGAQVAHRGYQGVTMSGSSLEVLLKDAETEEMRARHVRFATDIAAANERYKGRMAKAAAISGAIMQGGQAIASAVSSFGGAGK